MNKEWKEILWGFLLAVLLGAMSFGSAWGWCLLIDTRIRKQGEGVSNAEASAVYFVHASEIDPIWAKSGTLREAVDEWLRRKRENDMR